MRKNTLLVLSLLCLANHQLLAKQAVIDDDDLDIIEEKSTSNRANNNQNRATKIKSHTLKHRLGNDNKWTTRGSVELSQDSGDKIVGVNVLNNQIADTEDFKKNLQQSCEQGQFYQLYLEDFDLLTSIPACLYSKNGLNDTLTFQSDSSGKLTSMQFEFIDNQYLASIEKHPRKKRLLTTKQYEEFDTKSKLAGVIEGTRPIFNRYKYDSMGKELKERAPVKEGEEPQEEQSFLRKYWLYILLAFMVLPNLLGGSQEEAPAGAAPARK
eukprot:403375639